MTAREGDLVEIVALPALDAVSDAARGVYQACLGLRAVVERVDGEQVVVSLPGATWHHFPDVASFSLAFAACGVRVVQPFTDAEWTTLSDAIGRDAALHGVVLEGPTIELAGGVVGDLALPEGATAVVGEAMAVRVIQLNRKRRILVLYPA
jgi:hypothetical protein